METYTITRLEHWSDDQWEATIQAVEDVVATVAEEWEL